jgi:hypothetical protein
LQGKNIFQLRAAVETVETLQAEQQQEPIVLPTSDESEKLLRIRHSVSEVYSLVFIVLLQSVAEQIVASQQCRVTWPLQVLKRSFTQHDRAQQSWMRAYVLIADIMVAGGFRSGSQSTDNC